MQLASPKDRFPHPTVWGRADAIEAFGVSYVHALPWRSPIVETLGTRPADPHSFSASFPTEAAAVAHVRQAAREEAEREIARIDGILNAPAMRTRLAMARSFRVLRKRGVGILATESIFDHRRKECRTLLKHGTSPEIRRLPDPVRLPIVLPIGLAAYVVDTRRFPEQPLNVRRDAIARRHLMDAPEHREFDTLLRYELAGTPGYLSYDLPAISRPTLEGLPAGVHVFLHASLAEEHAEAYADTVRAKLTGSAGGARPPGATPKDVLGLLDPDEEGARPAEPPRAETHAPAPARPAPEPGDRDEPAPPARPPLLLLPPPAPVAPAGGTATGIAPAPEAGKVEVRPEFLALPAPSVATPVILLYPVPVRPEAPLAPASVPDGDGGTPEEGAEPPAPAMGGDEGMAAPDARPAEAEAPAPPSAQRPDLPSSEVVPVPVPEAPAPPAVPAPVTPALDHAPAAETADVSVPTPAAAPVLDAAAEGQDQPDAGSTRTPPRPDAPVIAEPAPGIAPSPGQPVVASPPVAGPEPMTPAVEAAVPVAPRPAAATLPQVVEPVRSEAERGPPTPPSPDQVALPTPEAVPGPVSREADSLVPAAPSDIPDMAIGAPSESSIADAAVRVADMLGSREFLPARTAADDFPEPSSVPSMEDLERMFAARSATSPPPSATGDLVAEARPARTDAGAGRLRRLVRALGGLRPSRKAVAAPVPEPAADLGVPVAGEAVRPPTGRAASPEIEVLLLSAMEDALALDRPPSTPWMDADEPEPAARPETGHDDPAMPAAEPAPPVPPVTYPETRSFLDQGGLALTRPANGLGSASLALAAIAALTGKTPALTPPTPGPERAFGETASADPVGVDEGVAGDDEGDGRGISAAA